MEEDNSDKKLVRICLNCDLILPANARTNKKFCDEKCRTRYAGKKRYERLKDNEEYKANNKKKSNEWRLKNPERFNELVKQCQARKRLRDKEQKTNATN